jgi:molecular chaperone HscB
MTTNPFETLGFPAQYLIEPKDLEARHRELSKMVHPDRHASSSASSRAGALAHAVSVNEAFRTLRDSVARAEALCLLRGLSTTEGERALPPDFLMDVMDQREALAHARAAGDRAALEKMLALAQTSIRELEVQLAKTFAVADQEPEALGKVLGSLIAQLRYAVRFCEEVDLSLETED